MSTIIAVKDYTLGAGETLKLSIPGSIFQLMSASSAVDVTFYRNDSEIGKASNVPEGLKVGPYADRFHRFDIFSAAAQTIKIAIADTEAVLQRIVGTITATIGKGATTAAGSGNVGAVSALLLAADSTRRSLTVRNTHASQTLYINGASPATTSHFDIEPGEWFTFTEAPKGAFYVIGSGAATTYAYLEEKD